MRQQDERVAAICRALRAALSSSGLSASPDGRGAAVTRALAELLCEAGGDLPEPSLEPGVFFDFLRDRFSRAGAPGNFEVRDLALVAACLAGHRGALARLDALLREEARTALSRLIRQQHVQDDVRQSVRLKLLVSRPQAPARLSSYLGSGPLRGWLRAVLVREAYNTIGRSVRETPLDEALLDSSASHAPDAELQYLRNAHRADFSEAFEWALGQLDDRERMLLSLHVGQGLSLDRLATLYKVSKATAGRWVASARERLLCLTRDFLCERLSLSDRGLDSLFRVLESDLNVSVQRLLRIPTGKV